MILPLLFSLARSESTSSGIPEEFSNVIIAVIVTTCIIIAAIIITIIGCCVCGCCIVSQENQRRYKASSSGEKEAVQYVQYQGPPVEGAYPPPVYNPSQGPYNPVAPPMANPADDKPPVL